MASLSPVASDQWGMLTAAQARRLGVSRVDLNRLVKDGSLGLVTGAARVYRLTGVPEDPDQDPVRAAWLQLGKGRLWEERVRDVDAVVSQRSAAHVRGLGDLIPRVYEFYVPTRVRLRRTDLRLRVRPRIARSDWNISGGQPVCTIERIVADLLGTTRTSPPSLRSSATRSAMGCLVATSLSERPQSMGPATDTGRLQSSPGSLPVVRSEDGTFRHRLLRSGIPRVPVSIRRGVPYRL
jgi:hypothetical protein